MVGTQARRHMVAEILYYANDYIKMKTLAERLGVSYSTIRNDVDILSLTYNIISKAGFDGGVLLRVQRKKLRFLDADETASLLRIMRMLVGVFFMGVSVALLVRSDMGTNPFTTACLAFARKRGWLLGTAELLVNGIMFVVVLWQGRKQIGLGTLANMVCIGYIADFVTWCMQQWSVPVPQTLLEKTIWMIPSLAIFVVAAAFYMTAQMGTAPYDAMSFVLAGRVARFPFRVVRMAWDLLWIVLTLVLGGTVGPVTVAIMLTMGPVVDVIGKWTEKHLYRQSA